MATQICEADVEAILVASNYPPLSPQAKGWISFYCENGFGPDWIAARIKRVMTLKDFLNLLRKSFPSLSEDDLENLAQDYLNGDSATDIQNDAKARAKAKATANFPKL